MSEFMSGFMLEPYLAYNWMIVVYFFVGGLSSGAYLLSVAAHLWFKDLGVFKRTADILAPLVLLPGLLLLVLDLGRPDRALLLGRYFNPQSVLSWGSIFLGIFFAISVLNALAHWKGGKWTALSAKLAPVGVPVAVVVASYTGLLLNRAPGFVLWHSALLPVLFLNGGLISGIALTMLFTKTGNDAAASITLGRIAAAFVALELVMVIAEVLMLAGGGTDAAAACRELLAGRLSIVFWGLQIVAGTVLPGVLLATGKAGAGLRAVASVLLLVGVYAMRHIVVIGGQIIG